MNRKLLLFDVDGTLCGYDAKVPASAPEAIKKARENGHIVVIVTGRMRNRALVGGIEADGMICGNGAYLEISGNILKDLSLSAQDIAEVTDYLDENSFDYFMEGNEGLYGSRNFETNAVPYYEKYGIRNPVIRRIYPMMTFPESMHQPGVTKINYLLHTYQDYLTFKEHFSRFQCLTWGGKGEDVIFGDCALYGIDKNTAIQQLIAYLDIPREDIFAFGDAEVDIPMFEAAGNSVCMGGGREGAKAAADFVTDTVENDGIQKALEHFKLI